MDEEKLKQTIDAMDADDGFYVESLRSRTATDNDTLALYLGFRLGGVSIDLPGLPGEETTVCLRRWNLPTEKDIGECSRAELLWAAICRYVNTGGKIEQLQRLLAMANMSMRNVEFDFGDRYLIESRLEGEDYLHEFGKPKNTIGVHWWENNYVTMVEFEGGSVDGEVSQAEREPSQAASSPGSAAQPQASTESSKPAEG